MFVYIAAYSVLLGDEVCLCVSLDVLGRTVVEAGETRLGMYRPGELARVVPVVCFNSTYVRV